MLNGIFKYTYNIHNKISQNCRMDEHMSGKLIRKNIVPEFPLHILLISLHLTDLKRDCWKLLVIKTAIPGNFLQVLCRYRSRWNLDLQFRPFYLAGVMGASGKST